MAQTGRLGIVRTRHRTLPEHGIFTSCPLTQEEIILSQMGVVRSMVKKRS